jgi:putative membrane-bound dehydrogenase-like protein
MSARTASTISAIFLILVISEFGKAAPRVVDERYKLELVASEPLIVTPIGLAFDCEGRLLVVESHTHDRPDGYDGPGGDRILMLADSDGDGRLDRWSAFAEGIRDAMNLLVRPDGGVYVVTGKRLLLLKDTDRDGKADHQEELLRLETKAPNPHNSLNGIARQPLSGGLLIGLGQTRTFPYRLIDVRGSELSGTDGAGAIFRISESGGGLVKVATGFWNPFSICTLQDGRIFAVDNDPDSSPPCRLLHVVWAGDYGYRYQYTRGGTHPLQAWNGELPGTLPMVCGTGEAPTAIVPHAGSLWVTSWGDHRIERYRLVPRGASYGAEREVIVQGDHEFRPTGMAVAPDGSLYFGDWVKRDYPVHGKGRIWRLVLNAYDIVAEFPPKTEGDQFAERLRSGSPFPPIDRNDPFIRAHGAYNFSRDKEIPPSSKPGVRFTGPDISSPGERFTKLAALRYRGVDQADSHLRNALQDDSADVRLFAVRWIADERIVELRDDVARLLERPPHNRRYYLAVLAAVDWLDHGPELRGDNIGDELLVRELQNTDRSPEIHTLAMSLLSPDSQYLKLDRLKDYLAAEHLPLRLEAIRALAQQSNPDRFKLLAAAARDDEQNLDVRAEAIVGLSAAAKKHVALLEELAQSHEPALRHEAERALRLAGLRTATPEAKPPADNLPAWYELLQGQGDAAAGRRLFFNPVGPRCSACHRYEGRGANIGPELTHLGQGMSRERIIASILQPSREIGPDYQPWLLVTKDGQTHLGLRAAKPLGHGMEHFVDSAGEPFSLTSHEIEMRQASSISIMPDGIDNMLTIAELRDLVTFLTTPPE